MKLCDEPPVQYLQYNSDDEIVSPPEFSEDDLYNIEESFPDFTKEPLKCHSVIQSDQPLNTPEVQEIRQSFLSEFSESVFTSEWKGHPPSQR